MNSTDLDRDNLRIEIGILQQSVDAFNPGIGKFRIPALMTENTVGNINTSNSNIMNRRNGNIGTNTVNMDNYLEIEVPVEYTFSYGADVIPAGTKFLISLVGGNDNDMRIIGRYSPRIESWDPPYINWLDKKLKLPELRARVTRLEELLGILTGRVDNLAHDLNNVSNNLNNVANNVNDLSNNLNHVSNNVNNLSNDISNVSNNLNNVSNNVNNLSNDLNNTSNNHSNSINNLSDRINNLSDSLNNLINYVNSLSNQINNIANEVASIPRG